MPGHAWLHLALHLAVPALIAGLWFRRRWRVALGLLLLGLLIDVDHLLAQPIYDPNRASLGFHPLHTWPAIAVYAALLLPRTTRLVGTGLLIHIALDAMDALLR